MQPLKAGDTIAARIDGAAVTLTAEERQYIEPANYCHESGWWCFAVENEDTLYFVSDDGRIDRHDPETFACLEEGVGVDQDAHDAYWRMEAAAEEAEGREPVVSPDVCACGHWSRHHTIGKHDGCGHCSCRGFAPDGDK